MTHIACSSQLAANRFSIRYNTSFCTFEKRTFASVCVLEFFLLDANVMEYPHSPKQNVMSVSSTQLTLNFFLEFTIKYCWEISWFSFSSGFLKGYLLHSSEVARQQSLQIKRLLYRILNGRRPASLPHKDPMGSMSFLMVIAGQRKQCAVPRQPLHSGLCWIKMTGQIYRTQLNRKELAILIVQRHILGRQVGKHSWKDMRVSMVPWWPFSANTAEMLGFRVTPRVTRVALWRFGDSFGA